jgi:peroxiredoxin
MLFACKEEATYAVKIKLENLNGEEIYAVFEADDAKEVDTLTYEGENEFRVFRMHEKFRTMTLSFEHHRQWLTVYLEQPHTSISVTGDMRYPRLAKVKGGRTNNLLSAFREKNAALLKEQTDLMKIEQQNSADYTTRLANVSHELRQQAETFIKKYPNERASAILIREYLFDPEMPLPAEEYLQLLPPELDDFHAVREMKASIEKAKRTIVGASAPAFQVVNLDGTVCVRESFFGHYFVLAFVARWSDECQTQELLLDRIIASFPKDSLEVMLVTLDENPQSVREAIRRDSISWNIVTDSAGQAIELMDLYSVNLIPRCYLIDGEGNILLKTENGIELGHALEERLNGKKDAD